MADSIRKEKIVIYYCPGCKKEVTRRLAVAYDPYESLCEKTGQTIKMKRKSWRYAS